MELYIIILKGIMNRKMKGIKVKDLKIECEYFDFEIPQEYLEKKPGGPITDEDIKEFFSEATESEIESALCGLPKFLDRVKKVLGS